MDVYRYILVNFYNFLDFIKGGFSHQTPKHISFLACGTLSIFELINFLTVCSNCFQGYNNLIPYFIFLLFNFFVFSYNDKFLTIIESYKKTKNSSLLTLITLSYIIGTLILFGYFL